MSGPRLVKRDDASNEPLRDLDLPPVLDRSYSSLVRVDIGAATHVGRRATTNEDSYIVYRTGRYWERIDSSLGDTDLPSFVDEAAYTLAVADGVGGSAAGEVASTLALRTILGLILGSARWAIKLDDPATRDQEIEASFARVQEYLRKADETLVKQAEAYPALAGMGTTLTGAYSTGRDLFTVHVGDSRAYLFRKGRLSRLTHDQTVSQALADQGSIAQHEVARHWMRHTLTSCLGGRGGSVDVRIGQFELQDGDRLVVCTDGLTDMVPEVEIGETLTRNAHAQTACDALVALALEKGGRDNVTVLVAAYALPA